MELNSVKLHFPFFLFSSLIILAHAKLYLDRSDYNAFKIIQRDLGINGHHSSSFIRNPCNSPAVSYEGRISNYTSVLKITRIGYDLGQLRGFLSPVIGQLAELRELTVSNNHLVDQIPQEIVDCRKLQVLNLKNNHFSGHVPPELSKLVRLQELDLSSNQFSGGLSFLRYFPNLEKLSLADNLFTGKIPPSLKSFRNLQFFDISGNDYIQGPFPTLNRVEYISSRVPKRYRLAENSTRSNHSRNTSYGPAQAPTPSAAIHRHHHKGKKKKLAAWLLGFLVGGVVRGVSGMVFSVFVKMGLALIRGRGKGSGPAIFSPTLIKKEDLAFLEKEDGLASLQLIGKGGCGEVYKTELPGSNGKMIAVKKIVEPPKEAAELTEEESWMLNKRMRQIRSEIQTVGRIRHHNLLPLLAHVPRPNCHYLVYEYMKNGSLEDIMRDVAQGNRELD